MEDEELDRVWREAKNAKRNELVNGRSDEGIGYEEWIEIVHQSNLAGLRAVRDAVR